MHIVPVPGTDTVHENLQNPVGTTTQNWINIYRSMQMNALGQLIGTYFTYWGGGTGRGTDFFAGRQAGTQLQSLPSLFLGRQKFTDYFVYWDLLVTTNFEYFCW